MIREMRMLENVRSEQERYRDMRSFELLCVPSASRVVPTTSTYQEADSDSKAFHELVSALGRTATLVRSRRKRADLK